MAYEQGMKIFMKLDNVLVFRNILEGELKNLIRNNHLLLLWKQFTIT